MTHRNTSKTRSQIPVELLLGCRVRLPAITDFDLSEPILFKADEKARTVPTTFIIRKDMNTSFIQPENLSLTILVSDNQIARLDEDNVRTEPSVETISQSEPQLQNTDCDLHIKMMLLQSNQLQSSNNQNHQSLRENKQKNRKQPNRFGEPIPTNFLKTRRENVMVSKKHQKNLEVFIFKVSLTKRRTYLTNFVPMSIRNGHKTNLNPNFVCALSLSY